MVLSVEYISLLRKEIHLFVGVQEHSKCAHDEANLILILLVKS